MTLILELPPALERALEDKAHRAGVPLADFALDVLAREANGVNTDGENANGDEAYFARATAWLKEVEQLHSRIDAEIEAGHMKPVTADDITRAIDQCRAEREREMDEAAGISLPPEAYGLAGESHD